MGIFSIGHRPHEEKARDRGIPACGGFCLGCALPDPKRWLIARGAGGLFGNGLRNWHDDCGILAVRC